MWFDVQAALAEIKAGKKPGSDPDPRANRANRANPSPAPPPRLAQIARLARPPAQKLEITPGASDAETYLAFLHREGPQTYGAAASTLRWGATRAWQAEARLRAAGLVHMREFGKAYPTEGTAHGTP